MTTAQLTPRWYPLGHHPEQARLWGAGNRFRVVPAGRRSGKTEIAKRFLVDEAINFTAFPDGLFVAAAPTRDQAKRIYWKDLKALVPKWAQLKAPSETELTIYLLNGAEIRVVGMDKPERAEGQPLDGIVLDEFANMKAHAWAENVRPALSTKGRYGWAWLIGVPEGRNHYYDLYMEALRSKVKNPDGEWDAFSWFSSDILDPREVASAKAHLDPRTYRQEYEGSFENFAGAAYYTFRRADHASENVRHYYDEKKPLICTFDFNVSPGVSAISQEIYYTGKNPKVDRKKTVTAWIGEVWIPDNSNSRRVAQRILDDWGDHEGEVWLYGDATGGARGSAKVDGSDWELIVQVLQPHFKDRLKSRVKRSNPQERSRVNAVNSRFESTDGVIHMLVDPVSAPHLVADFEGVTLIEGTGEILKEQGGSLTHISDGAGYYVEAEFPCGMKEAVHFIPLS